MSTDLKYVSSHIVDIFGSTVGRDQPIMRMSKAIELVKCLDPKIITNDNYVFFDPFCKAGEILLAAALERNRHKAKRKTVNVKSVFKDLYESNRYFSLAPDERHHRLSLRTLLGNQKSHDNAFTKNIKNGAYLSEEDGCLDKEKFEQELQKMIQYITEQARGKKIIAVGNPPYQENDGGYGKSAVPVYNKLIECLLESSAFEYINVVIPARWFSAGRGLDGFRQKVIDSRPKKITFFENEKDVFPTVDIRGGVCFLLLVQNFRGETSFTKNNEERKVNLAKYDIIFKETNKHCHSIVSKVLKKSDRFVSELVWAQRPFGLRGYYFKRNKPSQSKNAIECFYSEKNQKFIAKINKSALSKNEDKVHHYKVGFPRAMRCGANKMHHFFLLKPHQVSTESYSIAASFKTKKEAENLLSLLQTHFAMFLISLRKPTQQTSDKVFAWVPLLDLSKKWSDEKLFQEFNITAKEQEYLKNYVNKLKL